MYWHRLKRYEEGRCDFAPAFFVSGPSVSRLSETQPINQPKIPLPLAAFEIFTDGSFDARTQTGGWAFVVRQEEETIETFHGKASANSNNSLELLSVIEAIGWLARAGQGRRATIWTDSAHVVEGVLHWRAIWRNNGWRRVSANQHTRKRPIPDADLWMRLDGLLDRYPEVTIAWCKGHSGLVGNEHADALARNGIASGRDGSNSSD
jgi:ribonuclease HI